MTVPRPATRHLAVRHVAVLLAGALLATLAVTAPALARTGDAVIAGEVRHGVEGSGVADVEVALFASEEGEPAELARTTTDADGTYRFEDAPTDVELEVVATYDGAPTRSGPFLPTDEGNSDLDLVVHDTTEDPADVRISSWVVWIDRDLGTTFQHDLQVDNTGERTWLGFDPDAEGTRTVLSVPLHADAFGLGFLGRFTECCATMRGTEYVHTSPLPPGRITGTVRYAVESTERLELMTRLPVEAFTLMLPEGVSATGAALERSGDIESQGTAYSVYTLEDWDPGEPLSIGLAGLEGAHTPWWWYLAAGTGGLLVIAGAAWWWRRQTTAAPLAADQPEPTTEASLRTPSTPDAAVTATPAEGDTMTATADAAPRLSAEVLLEELALLDVALERSLIDDEVHRELRVARTRELRSLRAPAGR